MAIESLFAEKETSREERCDLFGSDDLNTRLSFVSDKHLKDKNNPEVRDKSIYRSNMRF